MKTAFVAVGALCLALAPAALAQTENKTECKITLPQDLVWGEPTDIPAGAQGTVIEGDPSKAEPFTVRLRIPNGYKIPPHTHPTTENVTVLKGTFLAGMGEQFNEASMKAFGRDAFASIPANHAHYAMARGQTIVQVHAIGPFVLTYVNPADDPTKR